MLYLKCDAIGCDHKETVSDITEDMVGKPCPVCGENMLTQSDFEAFKQHMGAVRLLQALGLVGDPTDPVSEDALAVNVHHHAGVTTVRAGRKGDL